MDADNLMDFAVRTAQRAGEITLRHFGAVAVEFKPDRSEVTAADRESEESMRSTIADAFPDDGIFGEEGTQVASRSGRTWVLDPIDGTRSFASGVPLYGVLLALEDRGTPLLGCAHFPALTQTLVASPGAGAWLNGVRARVSPCGDLREARMTTSGLEYWRDWATEEGRAGLDELIRSTRVARTWGDCYGYALVATGRAEVHVEIAVGAYWDYLPLIPIVGEAGGRLTNLAGRPMRPWTSALASNGRLHDAAAACWGPSRSDDVVQVAEMQRRQADVGGGTPLAAP